MTSRDMLSFKNRTSYSVENPAAINYVMGKGVYGSNDGLVLHPPGDSTWKEYPSSAPLLKNPIFVPQGAGVPLRNEEVPVNIPDDSMFYFAKNVASPACSSSFSTSTGQICTTKKQRDFINKRGNNRCGPTNPRCDISNPQF